MKANLTLLRRALALALLLTFALAAATSAQTGGSYDLTWNTFDSGGVMQTTGGEYTLAATSGQPDAGSQSGGSYALSGGFWTGSEISTAVTLTGFQAAGEAQGIRLSWTVLDTSEIVGFHLYRRAGDSGDFTRVNEDLIWLQSASEYTWVDSTAQPGVAYEYQLEAVTVSQSSLWLGPVQAQHAPRFNLWLPVLDR